MAHDSNPPDDTEGVPGASGAASRSASPPLRVLPTLPTEIQKHAVDILEDLLERARAGKIGVTVVMFDDLENGYEVFWTGTEDKARQIGMVEMAKFRLLHKAAHD